MAMNKFMHPRNIYKNPPNFKELAIKYPEFRKHTKQELSGKVSIDFKDPAALRALTTTLLLKDFSLTVEIPLNRLVPTLPLRLNYLLWIEDLLKVSQLLNNEEVHGVDIGTGASCIYPLLAAKTMGWHMLATELDEDSFQCAKRNVENNSLENLIEVKKVDKGVIYKKVLEEDKSYTFTMCNPPFFGSEKEITESENRSSCRTPPSNSLTGSLEELVVEGGEVGFIRKIIQESVYFGKRVRLYTTMVGHKSNLPLLKKEIIVTGACSVGSYELCQGRTTRWVIAWTFDDEMKTSADSILPSKKIVSKPPFRYIFPRNEEQEYSVEVFCSSVKEILKNLEIEHKEIKNNSSMVIYNITAWRETWIKQRQKRRAAKRHRKDVIDDSEVSESTLKNDGGPCKESSSVEDLSSPSPNKRLRSETESSSDEVNEQNKRSISEVVTAGGSRTGIPVLKASLVIRNDSSDVVIELAWLEGSKGRDALHQVLQYIKNQLEK